MGILRSKFLRTMGYCASDGLYAISGLSAVFIVSMHGAVDHTSEKQFANTDTIFVLAGGSGRTEFALNIAESPQTLVIVGGNKNTRLDDFWAQANADEEHVFIGKDDIKLLSNSRTTEGNAMEIANWVQKNNLKSAIIVTSDYHAPRANYLIKNALPTDFDISFTTLKSNVDVRERAVEMMKLACHVIQPCHDYLSQKPLRQAYDIHIHNEPVIAKN